MGGLALVAAKGVCSGVFVVRIYCMGDAVWVTRHLGAGVGDSDRGSSNSSYLQELLAKPTRPPSWVHQG